MTKPKSKTYRVWIAQVNQTYVDVKAVDENDAKVKGYRVWRNEFGHSHVTYIAEIDEPEAK